MAENKEIIPSFQELEDVGTFCGFIDFREGCSPSWLERLAHGMANATHFAHTHRHNSMSFV